MKFWTKVCIIGTISFVALTVVAMIIASSIASGSNKLDGTSAATKELESERQRSPQAQALIDEQVA